MNNNPRWVFLGTRMQDGQHGNLVGPIDLDSLRRFTERLSAYREGARLMITVELEPRDRTLDQNAYYHGYIVTPLAEHLGYVHDDMHAEIKRRLLGGRSTKTLSPSQFNEFCEECRAWAMVEHEFYLAAPNEVSVPAPQDEETCQFHYESGSHMVQRCARPRPCPEHDLKPAEAR